MSVVLLARDTSSGPYLCLYQILSKYFKPLRRCGVHKNLAMKFGHILRNFMLKFCVKVLKISKFLNPCIDVLYI